MSDYGLVCILVFSIALIVFLISVLKIHAFLSLSIASVFVAITTKIPLENIGGLLENGIGGTLGFLASIIGCGAILGKALEISGGAQRIAITLLDALGEKRANIAMMLIGFIAGIPVFVEVGFVLLVPLVLVVSKELKISRIKIGMALATSLMVVHCIVPPHPAATAIVASLSADIGKVIALGLFVGIIIAFVGGVALISYLKPEKETLLDLSNQNVQDSLRTQNSSLPSSFSSFFVILLPLVLMLLKVLQVDGILGSILLFISNPIIALLFSVFVAYYLLLLRRGFKLEDITEHTGDSFAKIAGVLLIIGAGGAFNEVLIASGVGEALKSILGGLNLNPVFLAWLIAIILHSAVGSATVAMISAAGIVLPIIEGTGISREIIAVAIGSGAVGLTIVTDSLFWLIKESLGMSVKQMFKYYTSATTAASLLGLALTFCISKFI